MKYRRMLLQCVGRVMWSSLKLSFVGGLQKCCERMYSKHERVRYQVLHGKPKGACLHKRGTSNTRPVIQSQNTGLVDD